MSHATRGGPHWLHGGRPASSTAAPLLRGRRADAADVDAPNEEGEGEHGEGEGHEDHGRGGHAWAAKEGERKLGWRVGTAHSWQACASHVRSRRARGARLRWRAPSSPMGRPCVAAAVCGGHHVVCGSLPCGDSCHPAPMPMSKPSIFLGWSLRVTRPAQGEAQTRE